MFIALQGNSNETSFSEDSHCETVTNGMMTVWHMADNRPIKERFTENLIGEYNLTYKNKNKTKKFHFKR